MRKSTKRTPIQIAARTAAVGTILLMVVLSNFACAQTRIETDDPTTLANAAPPHPREVVADEGPSLN